MSFRAEEADTRLMQSELIRKLDLPQRCPVSTNALATPSQWQRITAELTKTKWLTT
jgi:hypothetical protein